MQIIEILSTIFAKPWIAIIIVLYAIGVIVNIKLKEILELITGKLEDRIKIPEFKLNVEWIRDGTPPGRVTTYSIFRNNSPFRLKTEYIHLDLFFGKIHIRNYLYDREKDSKVPEGLKIPEDIMGDYADSWNIETADRFSKEMVLDYSDQPQIRLEGEVKFSTLRGYRKVPKSIDESEYIDAKVWKEIKDQVITQQGPQRP